MDLGAQTGLLVATLELNLVRLIRGAMRAADQAAAASKGGECACGGDVFIESRPRLHPEPVIEPRRRFHPEPRFEPRPVLHPAPRVEPCAPLPVTPVEAPCPAPAHSPSPLQPPWKVLPWEKPVAPPPKVKVVLYRTDVIHKGSLLDLFI